MASGIRVDDRLAKFPNVEGLPERPDLGGRERQDVDVSQLPEDELLQQAKGVASELLAGEIPKDVQQQVEQIAAERALGGGLGQGEAARFLTARDLGRTSLDLVSQGAEIGFQASELEQRQNLAQADLTRQTSQFNEELNLKYQTLQEDLRRSEDNLLKLSIDTDLKEDQINLAAAELVSKNQQFMQGLTRDLVIQNSRFEVAGLQAMITDLGEFFNMTDNAIMGLFGIRAPGRQ